MSSTKLASRSQANSRKKDTQYNKLRVKKQMETFRFQKNMEEISKDFYRKTAKIKLQSIDMKREILQRVQEERELLKNDVDMLIRVDKKISRIRKVKKADLIKHNAKRRNNANFAVLSDEPLSQLKKWGFPERKPQLKIDFTLIYPKVRRRSAYTRMMVESHVVQRKISRINEKSLIKLRSHHLHGDLNSPDLIIDDLEDTQAGYLSLQPRDEDPFITCISHLLHRDSRELTMTEKGLKDLLQQIRDTREHLAYWAHQMQPSQDVTKVLEECTIRIKKVKKKTERSAWQPGYSSEDDSATDEETSFRLPSIHKEDSPAEVRHRKTSQLLDQPNIEVSSDSSDKVEVAQHPERKSVKLPPVQVSKTTTYVSHDDYSKEPLEQGKPLPQRKKPLSPIISRANTPVDEPRSREMDTELPTKTGENEEVAAECTECPVKPCPPNKHAILRRISSHTMYTEKIVLTDEEKLVLYEELEENEKAEFDPELWEDVLKCRYIRGHEPKEMELPEMDAAEFVFGDHEDGEKEADSEEVVEDNPIVVEE